MKPGTRLGSYEVVGPLGAGGMGEVYRATDSALKRSVAIVPASDAAPPPATISLNWHQSIAPK